MPIRPELRIHYGPEWRKVIRPRILKRAENCCENCRVPNHTSVKRIAGTWREQIVKWSGVTTRWRDTDGAVLEKKPAGSQRTVYIVLTVAHLNHVSGDDRDKNLKALCQWCHLRYDQAHHRETREARKDASRPLLEGLSPVL